MTLRLTVVCWSLGLKTLGDLATRSSGELRSFKNCGQLTVHEADVLLWNHGLRLSGERPDVPPDDIPTEGRRRLPRRTWAETRRLPDAQRHLHWIRKARERES